MGASNVVPYFITGIGTDVGKTFAAAIMAKALDAWYWKPVQAGLEPGTDLQTVQQLSGAAPEKILKESYRLEMPASPHWSAREQGEDINLEKIKNDYLEIVRNLEYNSNGEKRILLIEGAGGLLVPLNQQHFVADLIQMLDIPVVLVSRHYLGSINHSLLTAQYCRQHNIVVKGWIFNGSYGNYEKEISHWSGFDILAEFPDFTAITPEITSEMAGKWTPTLKRLL